MTRPMPGEGSRAPVEVYYNSACPVCRAGINAQRENSSACEIDWLDVHADKELVENLASPLEGVRERLHVRDADGQVQVGFDAFIALWRVTAKDHWKARLFGLPVIRQLGKLGYNGFAALLYRWNRRKGHW